MSTSVAFLPAPPNARFAAYADEEDGSVITRPVDFFVLFAAPDRNGRVVRGFSANDDGFCDDDANFLGYAESEAQAKTAFAEDAKKLVGELK